MSQEKRRAIPANERSNPDFLLPMNLAEMMAYLRIGRNSALRLLRTGLVQGNKVGRAWRTTRAALDAYVERQA